MEDAGRGWRRTVPSPAPLEILSTTPSLTWCARDIWLLPAGRRYSGGARRATTERCRSRDDKDLASALLASQLGADLLVIPPV